MLTVLVRSDTRYPVNRKIIRKAAADTLSRNSLGNIRAEISVAVVGERKMRELCRKYLSDNRIHEVLSFPFEDSFTKSDKGFINVPDDILRLGEIVLCWPQVLLAAARDDVMVDDEVYQLVAHSVEHLMGKHHE